MPNLKSPFRLNVGYIIAQGVGYVGEFAFNLPEVELPPDLVLRNLTGTVRINRTPQGLPVQAKMRAELPAECGRCLTSFIQPLEIDFTELFAFSKRSTTEAELLLPEDAHIDLEPLIREYMLLEVPISPLCREDCLGLCPICGESLNDKQHNHEDQTVDDRLSVLKKLLDEDHEEDQGSAE